MDVRVCVLYSKDKKAQAKTIKTKKKEVGKK
jgi:hypothetical protein